MDYCICEASYADLDGGGVVYRTVLVLTSDSNKALVCLIKKEYYKTKKDQHKQYYKIDDYEQAGVEQQSYIVAVPHILPMSSIKSKIGVLSAKDKLQFIKIME